jgi:predicted GIY-YIG superfamily endonuclease
MVYAEEYSSAGSAIAREHQLKRWTLKKKEALIAVDRGALKALGRRSTKPIVQISWRGLLNGSSD